ncbi:FMN-binding split barrel-related protein [Cordyceps fumosorosea ARSEF 2679]|uniref:FMN-binding split barrel-related protein n=1 Tax=Cordyceps fumosorosea (strain ARSEF 2679) TaxID=1081104 RepID=A0A168ANJ3_CORFA|nr:FMN-binding split barrel-related protein [Cordyceps fumosorosea ARSEF 2679]OAA68980.1 FMN-binding split barrel-related protein [Cordyceps fumosorosea ARSEF 2679]
MGRFSVSPAPWRAALVSHLEAMDSPTFVLSSLHREPPSAATQPPAALQKKDAETFSPRARTVVYRSMWAGLSSNPRNPAPPNPHIYQTDLLTTTTDVRMDKVSEMFPALTNAAETASSCAGEHVEGVIWAANAKTQWRIRGRVFMIGPDIESDAAQPVREALKAYMRRQHAGNREADAEADTWDWAKELTAHFGNLSPVMRGSFRNPPPGTPISQTPSSGLGLGQKVENLHDEIARSNFRVLVIVPEQVDQVDLSDPERGRRWRYDLTTQGDEVTWTTTELWP